MVERSLSMREVRGSMPLSSIFFSTFLCPTNNAIVSINLIEKNTLSSQNCTQIHRRSQCHLELIQCLLVDLQPCPFTVCQHAIYNHSKTSRNLFPQRLIARRAFLHQMKRLPLLKSTHVNRGSNRDADRIIVDPSCQNPLYNSHVHMSPLPAGSIVECIDWLSSYTWIQTPSAALIIWSQLSTDCRGREKSAC